MHGLQEIIFLNRNNRQVAARQNASDPGHNNARRAEKDLSEALNFLDAVLSSLDECETCPEKAECESAAAENKATRFPRDFSVIRHADEAWVLPLTSQGQTVAAKVIPAGTRRYGLHYILTGEEGLAIANSIASAS